MSCSPNELAYFPVIPREVKSQRDVTEGRRCQKVLMVVRKALIWLILSHQWFEKLILPAQTEHI